MHNIDPKQKTYGFAAALASFAAWGLLPLYWKSVITVDPFEILCHRIVWSLVFIAIILTALRGWGGTFAAIRSKRDILVLTLSSLMIGVNWMLYIWAVNTGHVIETSLGYYINPLVNVLFGFLFFRERLKPMQMIAIGLAALGVAYAVLSHGELPWISLCLAVTFALYGLLRKIAAVESLPGLFLETMILSPIALAYLIMLEANGTAAMFHQSARIDLLLAGAGAVTATPLIGFAYGARRLPLTVIGLLQYIAPSIAFCLGVFVYREHFTSGHLATFALIWAGLAVYTGDTLRTLRKHRRTAAR